VPLNSTTFFFLTGTTETADKSYFYDVGADEVTAGPGALIILTVWTSFRQKILVMWRIIPDFECILKPKRSRLQTFHRNGYIKSTLVVHFTNLLIIKDVLMPKIIDIN
jgi:hypothetical protein